VTFAEEVKRNKLIAAIQNTQELESGAFVESFTLTTPSTDVAVSRGTLAVLGSVTYA
jgi:hypothetical protein